MPEKVVSGTSIKESSFKKMLQHNREITGGAGIATTEAPVNHEKIAEGLLASQPVLLPAIARPRVRATRMVEGVQGTSPTPGQDQDLGNIPPTTSNTADPANIPAKGPDAENQPASKGRAEQLMQDIGELFAESDNPFGKKDGEDGDDKDEKGEKDGDEEDKDDKKDDKDGEDGTEDGDEEPVEESVMVHCESCGYEETYDLSESNLSSGNVPLKPGGELDDKCPMCGSDMDLSMIGATNTGEISDPNPRTDARGNSGAPQRESVSPEAVSYANNLMVRIAEGEEVDSVVKFVIEGDFMPRQRVA